MLEQVLIGILQGVFEWLPISSEGVVAIFSKFLVDFNAVDFALFLHFGTLFSVLVYFFKDWIGLFRNKRLFWFIFVSTIVSLIVGYPVYQLVRNVIVGEILLLVVGIGLMFTAYFHAKKKSFGVEFRYLALIAGVLQGLAVIPGLSRSGSTIFGLSFGDLSSGEMLKLSYMMSAPVVFVSTVYLLLDTPSLINGWVALLFSFVFGLISLKILMKVVERINFSKVCFWFGVLCFVGFLIGVVI